MEVACAQHPSTFVVGKYIIIDIRVISFCQIIEIVVLVAGNVAKLVCSGSHIHAIIGKCPGGIICIGFRDQAIQWVIFVVSCISIGIGDFNLIPPGSAYERLSAFNKSYFNAQGTEIALLFEKYITVPGIAEVYGDNYDNWYTNMATNKDPKVPDKTIDYFIFADGLNPDTAYVRIEDTIHISDHLPLIVKVTVPQ